MRITPEIATILTASAPGCAPTALRFVRTLRLPLRLPKSPLSPNNSNLEPPSLMDYNFPTPSHDIAYFGLRAAGISGPPQK